MGVKHDAHVVCTLTRQPATSQPREKQQPPATDDGRSSSAFLKLILMCVSLKSLKLILQTAAGAQSPARSRHFSAEKPKCVLAINPRRACAARVTVVGSVCLSVCLCVCYSQSHFSNVIFIRVSPTVASNLGEGELFLGGYPAVLKISEYDRHTD